jgi:hypothetical protein
VRGETRGEWKEYKMGGVYDTYGGQEKCVWGFGGETEVEEAIRKLWHRWEGYIKVGIKYIGRVWTRLIWFRTVASDGLL